MLTFLSLLFTVLTFILLLTSYFTYTYILKPYLLLQFYKKQGIETYFYPIIGNTYKNEENLAKNGDVYYEHKLRALQTPRARAWAMTVGDTVLVFLKDHELIRNYYLNHDQFYKKFVEATVLLKVLLGDGVLLSDGEVWKKHRKLASAAFNFEFLKEMIPEVVAIADEFLEKLKTKKDLGKVDMRNEIQRITGEIVGRIFFGDNFSGYELNGVNIIECLTTLFAEVSIEDFEFRSMFLGGSLIRRGILPPHKKMLKKIKEFRTAIRNIAIQKLESIEKEEKEGTKGKRRRVNLMELFYKQRKQSPQEAFNEDEIVDEFITFFIAGTDTTGHLLTMSTYYLLKNPHFKDKVFQEVDKLFSDTSSISIDTLNQMDYVTAFMKETLRMTPIGANLFHRIAKEDNDLGGLIIKKGTAVNISFLSNYYDADYHDDPYVFNPQRWLEQSKTKKSVSDYPFIYTPFSATTRNCMGQHLAMNEARIIFSLFWRKFNYELTDKDYVLRMTERFLYDPDEPIYYNLEAK